MTPPKAQKQRGLGRGLDALLAANNTPETQRQETLAVGALQPGKYQPRTRMDPGSLEELAASIKAQGLIQPISVRPVSSGRYEIIAGERRWRAAQIAGLAEVPVLIRDIPDDAALAMSLIENIQREDLNPLEEAAGIQRLIDEFQMPHQEAADAVGRSRSAASNLLRLLQLAKPAQDMLMAGDIEMGHARALLPLSKSEQCRVAAEFAGKDGLIGQFHPAIANNAVHVGAVGTVRRNASGGGVRVEQVAPLLQITHGVPDGRRRNPQRETLGNGARTRGLGRFDVGEDHRIEHRALAVCQQVQTGSKSHNDTKLATFARGGQARHERIEPEPPGRGGLKAVLALDQPALPYGEPDGAGIETRQIRPDPLDGPEAQIDAFEQGGIPSGCFAPFDRVPPRPHGPAPRGERPDIPASRRTVEAVRAGAEPRVRRAGPIRGVVLGPRSGARIVAHLVLLETGTQKRRPGGQEFRFVIDIPGRGDRPLAYPPAERRPVLHGQTIGGHMIRFERQQLIQVSTQVAIERGRHAEDQVHRHIREARGPQHGHGPRRRLGTVRPVHPCEDPRIEGLDAERHAIDAHRNPGRRRHGADILRLGLAGDFGISGTPECRDDLSQRVRGK